MNIIDKEIERRLTAISDNKQKVERIAELVAEVEKLNTEVEAFDEKQFLEEIEELKTYLVPVELEPDLVGAIEQTPAYNIQ